MVLLWVTVSGEEPWRRRDCGFGSCAVDGRWGLGGVQEYDPCASRPALRLALLGLSSAVSDGPL